MSNYTENGSKSCASFLDAINTGLDTTYLPNTSTTTTTTQDSNNNQQDDKEDN